MKGHGKLRSVACGVLGGRVQAFGISLGWVGSEPVCQLPRSGSTFTWDQSGKLSSHCVAQIILVLSRDLGPLGLWQSRLWGLGTLPSWSPERV